MRWIMAGTLCVMATAAAAATAATNDAAGHWRELARIDVEAAYALVHDNHPAAVAEAGDAPFRVALELAHRQALARARTVDGYPAYLATLGEFANALGDGHIVSQPRFVPRRVRWAGLLVARRGTNWVVAKHDQAAAGNDLTGARIVRCDGKPADDFARETIGTYRIVWKVEAFRAMRAGWLLVDDGNPFIAYPRQCIFEREGRSQTITLEWRPVSRATVATMMDNAFGSAGFGVRPIGKGYWLAMESLTPEADAVIAAADNDRVRSAPFVVIDLRGNGGGNDNFGRRLAEVLYGADHVRAVLGPGEQQGGCQSVFRASEGNIRASVEALEEFRRRGDTAATQAYSEAIGAMRAAMAAGEPLAGDTACRGAPAQMGAAATPSRRQGKVYVLTDSVCFSSCISTVGFFRRLGAIQIGQITGVATHYSEVREETLPSGLSVFSTLQALMPDQPAEIGPFAPAIAYEDDIADTAALEKWVLTLAHD